MTKWKKFDFLRFAGGCFSKWARPIPGVLQDVRKSLPCREGEFTNEIDPNKIRYLWIWNGEYWGELIWSGVGVTYLNITIFDADYILSSGTVRSRVCWRHSPPHQSLRAGERRQERGLTPHSTTPRPPHTPHTLHTSHLIHLTPYRPHTSQRTHQSGHHCLSLLALPWRQTKKTTILFRLGHYIITIWI